MIAGGIFSLAVPPMSNRKAMRQGGDRPPSPSASARPQSSAPPRGARRHALNSSAQQGSVYKVDADTDEAIRIIALNIEAIVRKPEDLGFAWGWATLAGFFSKIVNHSQGEWPKGFLKNERGLLVPPLPPAEEKMPNSQRLVEAIIRDILYEIIKYYFHHREALADTALATFMSSFNRGERTNIRETMAHPINDAKFNEEYPDPPSTGEPWPRELRERYAEDIRRNCVCACSNSHMLPLLTLVCCSLRFSRATASSSSRKATRGTVSCILRI